MSSKRHLRRRQCEGKKRHASYQHAMIHLCKLKQTFGDGGQIPYRCQFCGGWHVGHPIGLKAENPTLRLGRRA
jgi:hypothetical protein